MDEIAAGREKPTYPGGSAARPDRRTHGGRAMRAHIPALSTSERPTVATTQAGSPRSPRCCRISLNRFSRTPPTAARTQRTQAGLSDRPATLRAALAGRARSRAGRTDERTRRIGRHRWTWTLGKGVLNPHRIASGCCFAAPTGLSAFTHRLGPAAAQGNCDPLGGAALRRRLVRASDRRLCRRRTPSV